MMKKIAILLGLLLLCIGLVACGAEKTPMGESTEEVEKTPIEQLTEDEKILFEALLKASAEFYEPSAVRLLEVGDYIEREHSNHAFAPDLGNGTYNRVTIRLQGENKVGGTLNYYYWIRLDTPSEYIVDTTIEAAVEEECRRVWDTCPENESPKKYYTSREAYKKERLESYEYWYCTKADYAEHFGRCGKISGSISRADEDKFSVVKINKALKYYWDERLGNS